MAAAADPAGDPDRGTHSLEVELKFDVADDTPLPDWALLPGVTSVGPPERRELDARYLDRR